jgi:hypothetical protein
MTGLPKWAEKWQSQRSEGRMKYIIRVGVLGYGLAMFIAMTFFISPPKVLDARSILVNAAVWAVGGVVFGLLTWWVSEWRYLRYLAKSAAGDGRGNAA